jgi:DNA-binding FrmR family transcriptional regulator
MEIEATARNQEPMLTEAQEDAIHRLRCAEGHTRGVVRMVESGAECIAIVQQVNAIQGALNKVSQILLYQHLELCISDTISADDRKSREQLVLELADLFGLAQTD